MATSPWKQLDEVKAERNYLVQLTYLPLKKYRMLFRFFRFSVAIQLQLQQTAGFVAFSMRARPIRRESWTLSVWTDREALVRFTIHAPHGQVMSALAGHMRPTVFIDWPIKGTQYPPSWKDALERFQHRTKLPQKGDT